MVIRSSFVEQTAPALTKKRQQPTSTTSFSTVVDQLLRRNAQSSASETSTDERVQAIRVKTEERWFHFAHFISMASILFHMNTLVFCHQKTPSKIESVVFF